MQGRVTGPCLLERHIVSGVNTGLGGRAPGIIFQVQPFFSCEALRKSIRLSES